MLDRLARRRCPSCEGTSHLRGATESGVDDRLRHLIDAGEEDGYGSSWRREWDGGRMFVRARRAR